ncbi:MAG: sensor histidine kinase, partial [Gemmatimonadaceae bacterium]
MTNAADPPLDRRFRLLPPNKYIAWTPYAWLIYLPTFLIEPITGTRAGTTGAGGWALTLLGLAVFLAAYFRGYWVRGRQLLPIMAIQLALGVLYAPVNTGSSVFFVYGASFAAQLGHTRDALRAILLFTAVAALTAWATHAPLYFWITAVGFTPLIAAVNFHFAQVGRANTKLRLAQEEVEHLAAVAERERIARDLHDVLGHTLSLIVLKAELAAKLAERDPRRAVQEIRDVEQVSRKALHEVRDAIRGYRATLPDEGERARSLLRAAGIACEMDVAPPPLDRSREEAVALALREAVTNVVRHSGASRCRVRVAEVAGACVLEVTDDGRGGDGADGSGLRGMRERVEALGGKVERGRERGTRGAMLRVTVPLGEER